MGPPSPITRIFSSLYVVNKFENDNNIETDIYWFLTYLRVQEVLDMTYVNAIKSLRVDIITISISDETRLRKN